MEKLLSSLGQLLSLLPKKNAMFLFTVVPLRQHALVLKIWPPQLDGALNLDLCQFLAV